MRILDWVKPALAFVFCVQTLDVAHTAPDAEPIVVTIFESVAIEYDPDLPERSPRDGYTLTHDGQVAERTLGLPPTPMNQRDAMRIVATVTVQPRLIAPEGPDGSVRVRPGDPWPRMGNVTAVLDSPEGEAVEVELMRFITGFGGPGTFRQDLTALAPLLHGRATLRVMLTTYKKPGWDVSLTLAYTPGEAGHRRPVFARPLFKEQMVMAEANVLRTSVVIPQGLDRPRLRIITTGHATDGMGGDEFITRTHVLRIDGEEIARWRPWMEAGAALRPLNPMSGRFDVNGRVVWSSDLDRSGWRPGVVVWPLLVPVPELTPGRHEVEIEVIGIRPKDPSGEDEHHGYWRVSAAAVADEPWPGE